MLRAGAYATHKLGFLAFSSLNKKILFSRFSLDIGRFGYNLQRWFIMGRLPTEFMVKDSMKAWFGN